MITKKDYFNKVEHRGVNNLPETLRKSHDFVVKITEGGTRWDVYDNNDQIRKAVNLYFQKLDEFLSSKENEAEFKSKENHQIDLRADNRLPKPEGRPKTRGEAPRRNKAPAKTVSEKVEHIREEIKFIRRFVRLHNKIKSNRPTASSAWSKAFSAP